MLKCFYLGLGKIGKPNDGCSQRIKISREEMFLETSWTLHNVENLIICTRYAVSQSIWFINNNNKRILNNINN